MKLYYLPGACSLADHIVLEWIGAPYEVEEVPRDQLRSPAWLAINPVGSVPVLVEGDWVLTENVAILNYLADRFPAARLGGDGTPRSRAVINQWLAFLNADVHPAFKPIFGPGDFVADTAAHADLQARARARLRRYFERLDERLTGRDWLADERSIADPYLFVVLRWARAKHVDLEGLELLASFSQRMREDAGVRAALHAEGI